jgi:ribonuclease P/MRP protein subunit POP5
MGVTKDEKLKPLSPTLRQKKRFVKIKIISNNKFSFDDISKYLSKEITFYIGAIDYSKAGVWFLKDKFDMNKQELIIRFGLKYKEKIVAALALISELNKVKVSIEIVKISGTLKGLEI